MTTLEEIDRVFAPVTDVVVEFAQRHSLRLEKCVRGNAGWELTGPHPAGGRAILLLLHDASLGLGIGAVWQYPCPEMSRLYAHFRQMRPCPLNPDAVTDMLGKELQEILRVPFGHWTHIQPLPTSA
jgi:hypothetical protein